MTSPIRMPLKHPYLWNTRLEKPLSRTGHHTNNHAKCQKQILVKNTNLKVYNWHPILMLFHKPQQWTPHSSLNFNTTTCLHKHVSSIPICHNHFPKRAWLTVASFLIPRTLLAIGVHTLSHPPQPTDVWTHPPILLTKISLSYLPDCHTHGNGKKG